MAVKKRGWQIAVQWTQNYFKMIQIIAVCEKHSVLFYKPS